MTGVLPGHSEPVLHEWIDYNGHLNEGYYVVIFGHATDAVMEHIGLDATYRQRTECSLYTVESHVRYLREVAAGATPEVHTQIVDVDTKRLRLCHEMIVDGLVVATQEVMTIHVDQQAGRSSPLPAEIRSYCESLAGQAPDYAGRAIAMPGSTPRIG